MEVSILETDGRGVALPVTEEALKQELLRILKKTPDEEIPSWIKQTAAEGGFPVEVIVAMSRAFAIGRHRGRLDAFRGRVEEALQFMPNDLAYLIARYNELCSDA
jgi:hypothetical protein